MTLTPKEYAIKLIEKASLIIQMADKYSYLTKDEEKYFSVQIAINLVDETINNGCLIDEDAYVMKPSYIQYWQELKNELLKQQNNG